MKTARSLLLPGFTLFEVLVALATSALLILMLARTMEQTTFNDEALNREVASQRQGIPLRRMLHRDFQGVTDPTTIEFGENSVSFTTSNNMLLDGPLPVTATWKFSGSALVRTESIGDLSYSQSLTLLDNIPTWTLRAYSATTGEWLHLDVARNVAEQDEDGQAIRAIRIEFKQRDGLALTLVERFPDALFLQ